jgi:hypothetical protein
MAAALSERDWQVRLHIYRFFVEHSRPPTVSETAQAFQITDDEARTAYQRLHDAHTLLLDPGTTEVRMANPLSAVETPYRVTVNGRTYFANCAWDSIGIPAMLGADATIEAVYTNRDGSQSPAHYATEGGTLRGDDGLVHFPLPFHRWYDNQIHT